MCHCYGVKASEAQSSGTTDVATRQDHASKFTRVFDGPKQPIRGLWVRGTRYYGRLNAENPVTGIKNTRRVPLVDKENTVYVLTDMGVARIFDNTLALD